MKKYLFITSLILLNVTTFLPNASALTTQEMTVQFDALTNDCYNGTLTPEQWKLQAQNLFIKAYNEGLISADSYNNLIDSLNLQYQKLQKIADYNNEANANFKACQNSQITPSDYQQKQYSLLYSVLENGFINQAQYQDTLNNIQQKVLECKNTQKAKAAQNAQNQSDQGQNETMQIADLQTAQQNMIKQINALITKCENSGMTPDDFSVQANTILSNAFQNNIIIKEDYLESSRQIDSFKSRCESFQTFNKNIKDCADKHGPTKAYRKCAESEADKLIAYGYATQDDKIQFMQNIDASIENASYNYLDDYSDYNNGKPKEVSLGEYLAKCFSAVFEFRVILNPGFIIHQIEDTSSWNTFSTTDREEWDIFEKYGRTADYLMFNPSIALSFGAMWMDSAFYSIGFAVVQELGMGMFTGDVSEILNKKWFIGGTYFMWQNIFAGEANEPGFFYNIGLGLGAIYSNGDGGNGQKWTRDNTNPSYITYTGTNAALAFRITNDFGYYFNDSFGIAFSLNMVFPITDKRMFGQYGNEYTFNIQPGISFVYHTPASPTLYNCQ